MRFTDRDPVEQQAKCIHQHCEGMALNRYEPAQPHGAEFIQHVWCRPARGHLLINDLRVRTVFYCVEISLLFAKQNIAILACILNSRRVQFMFVKFLYEPVRPLGSYYVARIYTVMKLNTNLCGEQSLSLLFQVGVSIHFMREARSTQS